MDVLTLGGTKMVPRVKNVLLEDEDEDVGPGKDMIDESIGR